MKKIYASILTILLLAGVVSATAKPNQDLLRANYLYSHLAFNEAIPYYEKIADQMNDPVVYSALGDCYRLTKNAHQASQWYGRAVKLTGCPDDTKLHYGMALMSEGNYADAGGWLRQYQSAHPDDKRASNLVASCDMAQAANMRIPNGLAVPMPFNTDGSEIGPAIWNGSLVITSDTAIDVNKKIDQWTGEHYYNMYSVTCDMNGRCDNDLKKIGNVNIKYHDGPCTFTNNGSEMYFTRTEYKKQFLNNMTLPDVNGFVHLEIMHATDYDGSNHSFRKITPFPFNSRNYSTAHPTVSPSGNTMAFTSDMSGGEGGTDIYICHRNGNSWSRPENAGNVINTEGEETFPFLADDNTLYFASNGHIGMGGLDIYMSKWDYNTRTFSNPENLGVPVNSPYDDFSIALNQDGESGYFASDRPSSRNGDNIYWFRNQRVFLDLKVIDGKNGQPVAGATVAMSTLKDKRTLLTGPDGTMEMTQLYPQAQYDITVTKTGYEATKETVSTFDVVRSDTLHKTITLNPNYSIRYTAFVEDDSTRQRIEGAMVVMKNLNTGRVDSEISSTTTGFVRVLQPNTEYEIFAHKKDYYAGETKTVSTVGMTTGVGVKDINDVLLVHCVKLCEIIRIKNIYYDFNKANIREDAKPSLNKLIQLLQDSPEMKIRINSHADCRGSDAYNLKLTDARAASVVQYLIERGISKDRLQSKGFGKRKPFIECPDCKACTEEQHELNRRTEFEVQGL